MKRIKSILLLSLAILLFTTTVVPVYAEGTLGIFPTWPVMTDTQETFELWVDGPGTAYYPQLLLVMTETCWDGLTEVTIDFNDDGVDETLYPGDFAEADSKFVPPTYPEGIRYTNASLKDHLGIDGTDYSIYWTLVNFPDGDIINDPPNYEVTINLDSTHPKMLVYVYGKTVNSASETVPYDMKVPPTNPGFMVPEPATIAAVLTPTLTLIGYAYYKRKTFIS